MMSLHVFTLPCPSSRNIALVFAQPQTEMGSKTKITSNAFSPQANYTYRAARNDNTKINKNK
jgi:hypothetical protein